MRLLLAGLVLILAGCATTPEPPVVTKTEFVVRTAPGELKALPPYPAPIDPTKATQVELAQWLARNEEHIRRLERLIEALIKFYEAPVEGDKK
jgi:hypothetical protein